MQYFKPGGHSRPGICFRRKLKGVVVRSVHLKYRKGIVAVISQKAEGIFPFISQKAVGHICLFTESRWA